MGNSLDVALGRKIATLRELRGVVLAELAAAVCETPQRMAAIEAGEHVGAATLILISRALQVALPTFFYDLVPSDLGGQSGAVSVDEGLRMTQAFMRIRDPRVRALLLDIADQLGAE